MSRIIRALFFGLFVGSPALAAEPSAPSDASAPEASAAPGASAAAPAADWVEITLLADDPRAELYAKEPGRKALVGSETAAVWTWVCAAPCNQRVDPHRTYEVMGDGLEPSKEFQLAAGSGHVTLEVRTSSRGGRTAGWVLAGSAVALGIAGGFMMLLELVQRGAGDAIGGVSADAQQQLSDHADTYETIGLVMLGAGVALGATALFVLSSRQTGLEPAAPAGGTASAARGGIRLIPGGFAF